jgi:diketogulonate reductase-like aldo/keto reductase
MRAVTFPNGEHVPILGQGTWRLGERAERRAQEIAALREGVELGLTLIDTAEIYGAGATEILVGEALQGLREKIFLVSKAHPANADRARLAQSCEASLKRLKTDSIDLYLLHWRGGTPLEETIVAMEALRSAGKIRHWGVSNLGIADMEDLAAAGGGGCVVNQILYNLMRRAPELDLLPWLEERRIATMAYSPMEQGRLLRSRTMARIAKRMGLRPVQVALAWLLRHDDMIVIPKAGSVAHVREIRASADVRLADADIALIEAAFPLPRQPRALEML